MIKIKHQKIGAVYYMPHKPVVRESKSEKVHHNMEKFSGGSKIISLDKFSSLPQLFRVTAYVIRFKNKLLRLIRKDLENIDIGTKDEDHTEFITAEELLQARSLWIRDVQHEYLITDEKTFDSLKKQLKLFCDQNGLWRYGGGRINNAELNYDMKYPYILPKSKFAELLVMNSHTDVKHNDVKETLKNMRKEFWFTRSRNYIKKIIHSCHLCKYMERRSISLDSRVFLNG